MVPTPQIVAEKGVKVPAVKITMTLDQDWNPDLLNYDSEVFRNTVETIKNSVGENLFLHSFFPYPKQI